MKKVEIFIVCIMLLLLAFVVGCDDDPVYAELDHNAEIVFIDSNNLEDFQFVISEPNEVKGIIGVSWPSKHKWYCSCGQEYAEMLYIECGCGKKYNTIDILMKSIPTWPDYIELEKDLVLLWEDPEPDPNSIFSTDSRWIISKGTKIYFRNDK